MGVLLFIPLISKKFSNLWLLLPYLMMNLVTDYVYMHDVGFQYVLGSGALLAYLYVVNISEMPKHIMKMTTVLVILAGICGTYTYKGDLDYYHKNYKNNAEKYEDSDRLLQRIPKDVSITAETFLSSHLYNYKEVYMYEYKEKYTDYYVFQSYIDNYDEVTKDLESRGYVKAADNGKVIIYRSKDAPDLN